MKVNEFEDRQNDWLAQEMAREGYVNNTSGLERDHKKHERSKNWDAGAVSNAKEHEILHKKYSKLERNKELDKKSATTIIVIGIMLMYLIIGLISAILR